LEEAAANSGLAAGTIGNRLRDGTLPNAGSKGRSPCSVSMLVESTTDSEATLIFLSTLSRVHET
jgi:hypothetical protein